MITINWSFGGRVGSYGEIVSVLCLANNQSEIHNCAVTLILTWDFLKSEKTKITSDTTVDYIIGNFDFGTVNVIHKYGREILTEENSLKQWNKNFGDQSDKDWVMQSVYFPPTLITPKYNVVCSTINNKESFDTYHGGKRKWKDGLTKEQWRSLIDQPNTVHVDYRMPLHTVVEILQNCKVFIGYHGSCAWLARMMGIPLMIYSGDVVETNYCFPWRLDPDGPIDYDLGLAKVDHYKIKRNNYINRLRTSRISGTLV